MSTTRLSTIPEYVPTTWRDGIGEPINAKNLNKLETAIMSSTDAINATIDICNSNVNNLQDISDEVLKNSKDITTLTNNITTLTKDIDDINKTSINSSDTLILKCGSSTELID